MKQIIAIVTFIIFLGCGSGSTVSHPSKEVEQNSFYYEGDAVKFKVDSITEVYGLPTLPCHKDWLRVSYRGVYKKDSVDINTYYIFFEKKDKNYIFNIMEIEESNFKQFKFKIN